MIAEKIQIVFWPHWQLQTDDEFVRANTYGCFVQCGPAMKRKLFKGAIPLLPPQDSWDRLQRPPRP